jgi:glycine hydroxymethyltransferase
MSMLREQDPVIANAIEAEERRQRGTLELIASENFVSPAVLEAQGSVMTNKYAEGLPRKRYYGGCEFVDVAEEQAIDRLKRLFQADHANVQPHSGASANLAAYLACSQPGDVLMGMSLAHGGHLTHGHAVSVTGKLWKAVQYGVRPEDGRIDYDVVAALAREHRPRILVAGASAYPRQFDFARLGEIAREVEAVLVVDMAHIAGLIAAGLHPSPVPHADFVTSTTHKTLRGPRGGVVLCKTPWAEKLDKSVFPGLQGGPLMHVIAAKAVCFGEALEPAFITYQKRVIGNAKTLAATLLERGFDLVSGGTDNHLILMDLRKRAMTGKVAEEALHHARITVNKNAVPNDPQKPWVTSGIRIGTPALTTRGMGEGEMRLIGGWIARVLEAPEDREVAKAVEREVTEMAAAFPLFAREATVR